MMHYTFQLPEILVQNSLSSPSQVFQECWSGLPPPPPEIQIWTDLGTLGFDFPEHPPPPTLPKIQIWTDLGTLGLTFQNIPPPKKLKFRQILVLWVLTFQNSPPP